MEESTTVVDPISVLPDEVIHEIIYFLPIRDAIKTSVLSKKWRYYWTFNPNLDFKLSSPKLTNTVARINHYINAYKGTNLPSFRFSFHSTEDLSKAIEKWVDLAAAKHVQLLEVDVEMGSDDGVYCFYFIVPLSLFLCESIDCLRLKSCIFSPPLNFKGFPTLKTLYLRQTRISEEAVAAVLSKCPLLERLDLDKPEGIRFLKINTPNLQLKDLTVRGGDHIKGIEICTASHLEYLQLDANLETLLLKNVPLTLVAHFHGLLSIRGGDDPDKVFRDWASSIANLSNVVVLTVNMHLVMLLYAFRYKNGRNVVFEDLMDFHVMGHLDATYGVPALVTLFKYCPNLTTVRIDLRVPCRRGKWVSEYLRTGQLQPTFVPEEGETLEAEDKEEDSSAVAATDHELDADDYDYYHYLKTIVVLGFRGNLREMKLLKFMLRKAICLDKLTLYWMSSIFKSPAIVEELSQVAAESFKAQVVEGYCVYG